MAKIPIRITPDPIFQAVIEIRFVPTERFNIPQIFALLGNDFTDYQQSEIPRTVRESDSSLKYSPDGEFIKENLTFGFGKYVLLFRNIAPYLGWDKFYNFIKTNCLKLLQVGMIGKIERIGLRYYNIFKDVNNLQEFTHYNLVLSEEEEYTNKSVDYKSLLIRERYHFNLGLRTHTNVKTLTESMIGTLVDIDAFVESNLPDSLNSETLELINNLHSEEKKLFFSILTQDYVDNNLNPEYA